jgi:hypothetical protein
MNFAELAAQVALHLGKDDAVKTAIVARSPDIFYSFDAAELGSMSAHETAVEVLKKRGVRLNSGEDGVRALELFNQGMDLGRAGARFGGVGGWAADATALPADNAIEKFFRELAE